MGGGMSHQATPSPIKGGDDEWFLGISGACRRYKKSRMTIHRWVKAGILPAPIRIGARGRLFRGSELLAREKSWPRVLSTDGDA